MKSNPDLQNEELDSVNNPYRGTQDHGVPDNNDPTEPPDHGLTEIEWDPEPPAQPDPVPVRIIHDPQDRQRTVWGGVVLPINVDQISMLVSRDDTRKDLQISNDGPSDLYLSPEPVMVSLAPVKVASGGTFTTKAENPVYGQVASGSATARIAWERVQKL